MHIPLKRKEKIRVVGVGVDIVKVERVKKTVEKWGDAFLKKIFWEEEIVDIYPNKVYYQRLAGRFAAKEAIIKAMPKEYKVGFRDIIISHTDEGAPYCRFIREIKGIEVFVSVSHIEEYAVACVVTQKKS